MTAAPSKIASVVPAVPAVGKKDAPGMISEPQPIQQPNANAHSVNGVNLSIEQIASFVINFAAGRAFPLSRQN